MRKLTLLSIMLLTGQMNADLLIGYDCNLKISNVTTFSLTEVKPCTEKKYNITTEDVTIQLIQPRVVRKIKVQLCLVQMSHLVSRCGLSWFQTYEGGLYTEVPELDRYECQKMISERNYKIPFSSVDVKLNKGITVWRGETVGSNQDGGKCTPGKPFSHDSQHFDRPVRTTELKATIYEEEVDVDISSQKVIFSDGSRCDYLSQQCFTNQKGYAFWSFFDSVPGCFEDSNTWQVLYQGRATRVTEYHHGNRPYISYVFTKSQHDISIGHVSEEYKCNLKYVQTEHPKLKILEALKGQSEGVFPIKQSNIEPEDTNIMLYFNHKMVFMMRHVRMQIDELYQKVRQDKCQVEQLALRNELAIASISPSLFAYNYFKEPGYIAIKAGEVVHVAKCKRVAVKVRSTDECYEDLPVKYKNQSMFLTPVTRILKRTSLSTECNPTLGTYYEVNGIWYLIGKQLHQSIKPQVLAPNDDNADWEFKNIEGLAEGGIYDEKDLDRVQHMFIMPLERETLKNALVSKTIVERNGIQEVSFVNALEAGDYDVISEKMGGWISRMLHKLGIVKEVILDIFVVILVFNVIKFIWTKAFAIQTAKETGYGCIGYIAACFGSPLKYMMVRHNNKHFNDLEEMVVIHRNELNQKLENLDSKIVVPASHRREWVMPPSYKPMVV